MMKIMDASSDDSIGFSGLSLHEGSSEERLQKASRAFNLEDSGYSSIIQDSSPQSDSRSSYYTSQDALYDSKIVPETLTKPRKTLEGQERVDIIARLWKYPVVLQKILSKLEADDLVRCCLVCKEWNYICKLDSKAFIRRRAYLSHSGLDNKENMGLPGDCKSKKEGHYARPLTSTPLSTITASHQINFCLTPVAFLLDTPVQAPAVPRRDRFRVYYEEGRKLTSGKSLMPCPRCSMPSRVDKDINTGQCSEAHCRFQFCLVCLCEQHITTVCTATLRNTSHPKWPRSLTSRSSRRMLRRF